MLQPYIQHDFPYNIWYDFSYNLPTKSDNSYISSLTSPVAQVQFETFHEIFHDFPNYRAQHMQTKP